MSVTLEMYSGRSIRYQDDELKALRKLVIGDVPQREPRGSGSYLISPEWGDSLALDYVVGSKA